MKIKNLYSGIKQNLKGFYWSCLWITIGAGIVFLSQNQVKDNPFILREFSNWLMWVPSTWGLSFMAMCGFIILLGDKE
ncbi:hypothetical protein C0585_00965 [Candidatus Woesearchaeota archaeon]|uniref:hypothetical protein n=1 Tax=uncultured Arcobacter sp. TaxID=165434 RepID=UPI000CC34154|nr:hypothetical protein [uncultured Arcobacter sp.]PLW80754.1 MAG: hypothetical protein C0585_00965 [Candidatus Woesearchaeota archaeon]